MMTRAGAPAMSSYWFLPVSSKSKLFLDGHSIRLGITRLSIDLPSFRCIVHGCGVVITKKRDERPAVEVNKGTGTER